VVCQVTKRLQNRAIAVELGKSIKKSLFYSVVDVLSGTLFRVLKRQANTRKFLQRVVIPKGYGFFFFVHFFSLLLASITFSSKSYSKIILGY